MAQVRSAMALSPVQSLGAASFRIFNLLAFVWPPCALATTQALILQFVRAQCHLLANGAVHAVCAVLFLLRLIYICDL